MNLPKKKLLAISALILGTASFTFAAGDHSGHDHSHGDKKATTAVAGTTNSASFEISDSLRKEIDLQTQAVAMRTISGQGDMVIAIPKSSIFELDGKTYVYSQSESDENSFERWEVTTGASDEQFVEAATGVFPGDTLVSDGTTVVAQIQNGTYSKPVAEVEPVAQTESVVDPKTVADPKAVVEPKAVAEPEAVVENKVDSPAYPASKEGESTASAQTEGKCPNDSGCKFSQRQPSRIECDRPQNTYQHGYSGHGQGRYGYSDHWHGSHGHAHHGW